MAFDGSLKFDTAVDNDGFKAGLLQLKNIAIAGLAAIGAAGVAAIKYSLKAGAEFDAAMSQVAATMGKTVGEIGELRAVALKMGEETKFTSTEAANALNYLALAGYDAKTQIAALPNVLNLAAAGNFDLAYASDLVTDAMAVLGLGTGELTSYADKMAKTASRANTSVSQLGEAVLVAGGQASLAQMSVTEMNTALGILADNGMKGSEGGTMLRNALKNIYTPTAEGAAVMEALGVATADSNGKLRSLQDILIDLNAGLSTLSEADKMNVMAQIFDVRTIAAGTALLKDSGDRWNELAAAIDDSAGAAERMAQTQLDNLSGDMERLSSAAEGTGLALSDKLTPSIRDLVQGMTRITDKATRFVKGIDMEKVATASAVAVTSLAAGIGSLLVMRGVVAFINALEVAQIQLALGTMTANAATLIQAGELTALQIIVALFTGKVKLAAAAQALFAAATSTLAGVIGLASVAIAAFAGVVVLVQKGFEKAHPEIYTMREEIDTLTQSVEDSRTAYEDSIASIDRQRASAEDMIATLEQMSASYTGSIAEQNKMQAICNTLNSTYDGLSVSFDTNTGALSANAAAIRDVVAAQSEAARASAMMDRYVQLLTDITNAEYDLAAAQKQQTGTSMGALDAFAPWNAEAHEAQDNIDALAATLASLNIEEENFAAILTEMGIVIPGLNDDLAGTTDATGELAGAMDEATEAAARVLIGGYDVTDALETIGVTAEAAQQRLDMFTTSATNMFEKIDTKTKFTVAKMVKNLEANTATMQAWGNNIAAIGQKLPSDLMQPLIDQGPEQMAGVMAMLAGSSDEQLATLSAAWEASGAAAKEAWLQSFGLTAEEGDTEATTNPLTAMAEEIAGSDELTVAVTDAMAAAGEAYTAAASTLVTQATQLATDMKAPFLNFSSEFAGFGTAATTGLTNGINSGAGAAIAAAAALAQAIKDTFSGILEFGSPSKVMRRFGTWFVEGFTQNVKKGYADVRKTVYGLAQEALGFNANIDDASMNAGSTAIVRRVKDSVQTSTGAASVGATARAKAGDTAAARVGVAGDLNITMYEPPVSDYQKGKQVGDIISEALYDAG